MTNNPNGEIVEPAQEGAFVHLSLSLRALEGEEEENLRASDPQMRRGGRSGLRFSPSPTRPPLKAAPPIR